MAAAEAVSEFVEATRRIGLVARPPRLRAVAPALREPLARATALAQRLDAGRLEDSRLEEQRTEAAAALGEVVAVMGRTSAAVEALQPRETVVAVRDLETAVARLRAVGTASGAG